MKTRYSVPNGVVFIEDIKGAMPPDPFTDEKIQWTSACIAVVCMHEDFGQTELTLGPVAEVAPGYESSFEGAQRQDCNRRCAGKPYPGGRGIREDDRHYDLA